MSAPKPFKVEHTVEALPSVEGDYLLPLCLPGLELQMGQTIACLVLRTIEGQRVGVPMGHQALSELREVITEALRMLQAGDGDAVQ